MAASAILIALVVTSPDIAELGKVIQCGTGELPAAVCCPYIEEARKTADAEARKVLEYWINRNCRRKKD
jgi:hypothetical protein